MDILGYQYPPYHKDQNKYGGANIVFLRGGLTTRRLRDFERDTTEIICIELTICKKNWFIIFAYRPPISNNKYKFFSELSNSLNRASV